MGYDSRMVVFDWITIYLDSSLNKKQAYISYDVFES